MFACVWVVCMCACVGVCLCVISVHFLVLWLTTTAVYINGGWQHVDLFPLDVASTVLFAFVQMHQISLKKSCLFIFDNNFDRWGEIRHLVVLPSTKQYLENLILFIHKKSLKIVLHSFITSQLDYCSLLHSCVTHFNLSKLQIKLSTLVDNALHCNNYQHIGGWPLIICATWMQPEILRRTTFCNF